MSRSSPPAPVLGLLTGLAPPPTWHRLVLGLSRWCTPRAGQAGSPDGIDAWLASGSAARGLDLARRSGLPYAVLGPGSTVTIQVPGADPKLVSLPDPGIDAGAAWPTAPFVRARWRRRLGFDHDLVVDVSGLDADLLDTALALAAAVVAPGPLAMAALAWGQACVIDQAGAEATGAVDGRHALVRAPSQAMDAARDLAADLDRAAALGRRGRRMAEQVHDVGTAWRSVADGLGLVRTDDAAAVALHHLDELWTPARAPVRHRVAAAVGPGGY